MIKSNGIKEFNCGRFIDATKSGCSVFSVVINGLIYLYENNSCHFLFMDFILLL